MPNNDKVKIFVNKSVAERVLKRLQESSPEVTWRGETDLRDVFMNVAQMENVTALKILWEELGWEVCQEFMESISVSFIDSYFRARFLRSSNFLNYLDNPKQWVFPIENLRDFLPSILFRENGRLLSKIMDEVKSKSVEKTLA